MSCYFQRYICTTILSTRSTMGISGVCTDIDGRTVARARSPTSSPLPTSTPCPTSRCESPPHKCHHQKQFLKVNFSTMVLMSDGNSERLTQVLRTLDFIKKIVTTFDLNKGLTQIK